MHITSSVLHTVREVPLSGSLVVVGSVVVVVGGFDEEVVDGVFDEVVNGDVGGVDAAISKYLYKSSLYLSAQATFSLA